MDLYDQMGEPIRYDRHGNGSRSGRCFGGPRSLVQELVGREWNSALRRDPKNPEPYALCWPKRGCTVCDAGLLSRAQGCMLGQFAGDSLGGLVEFESAALIRRKHPSGVRLLEDGGTFGTLADSGEGERSFRRERERHSGPKANSFRSAATLAFRLCRKRSASSRKTYPERSGGTAPLRRKGLGERGSSPFPRLGT
jgi:hypothetical protein